MSLLVVSILVVLLPAFTIVEARQQGVFLLGHNFHQYDFSCTAGLLAALSEDRRSVFFYEIVEEHYVEEKKLHLPGDLLKWSPDGQRLVITQDSYMTVLYNGVMKTKAIPVVQASSVVVIEDLACVVPAISQFTYIVCMNLTTFEVKTCSYPGSMYAGSFAFADSVKKWVYVLEELDPLSVYKFIVGDGCLNYTRTNPDLGKYYFGNHIWYSYDGSRIFLDNGLTLTASSNPQTDMQVHGDFNSSYEKYRYNWFSQSGYSPYLIAGLRSDLNDTVLYYTWPYLQPSTTCCKPIPSPKEATRILGSEQVHTCSKNSLFVFSTYEMTTGVNETGVAYMTI